MLTGKGMYLWVIRRVEGGTENKPPAPELIAERAVEMGLSHVLIKVADSGYMYNITKGVDLVPPVVKELQKRGVQAWGWQYIYGYPEAEAKAAVKRITELGLDGFVVNAEVEYKKNGMRPLAEQYMRLLRSGAQGTPIGFSSYRYPILHRPLPFDTFLEYSDINMPQVYWVQANNPEAQLARSLKEYDDIGWGGLTIPTGTAYKEHGWQPTNEQVERFLNACVAHGLQGANFWEWMHAVQFGYEKVISEFSGFEPTQSEEEYPEIDPKYLAEWRELRTNPELAAHRRGK